MNNRLMRGLALIAAFVTVSAALAQDGGNPPPPPGQGPGMGHHHGPMGGLGLLLDPQVVNELKLSDDQITSIRALLGPPQEGVRPDPRQILVKIKTILTADQFTRFQQVQLQIQGAMAVVRPEIAKKLGLSDDQLTQIKAILEANRPQGGPPDGGDQGGPPPPPPGGGGPGGPGGPPPDPAQRAKVDAQIMAVLTGDQVAKWKTMLGAKFDFHPPGRPPRQ